MAKATFRLVSALRETAHRLRQGADYHWAHVGKCNCGHLAQTITGKSSSEIYDNAAGQCLEEWTEYAHDYCPTQGRPLDKIISSLLEIGIEHRDIHHLEYLSDMHVLTKLPGGMRYLRRNQPLDVALYMETWADHLETEMTRVCPANADVIDFPQEAKSLHG